MRLPMRSIGILKPYWRVVVRPYPKQAVTILVLTLGGAVLDMATVSLTVPLMDALTDPARVTQSRILILLGNLLQGMGLPVGARAVIFALMGIACGLFILRSGLLLLQQYSTAVIAQRLRRDVKLKLFGRFLKGRYDEVSKKARGTIVHHINNPAEAVYGGMVQLSKLLSGVLTCALMVGLMAVLSWWATLAIGAVAVGCVQGWRRYADRRAAACGHAIYDVRAEQSKLEVDAIDGLKIVKSQGLESRLIEREGKLLDEELRPWSRVAIFKYGPNLVNELIASAIVLGLGAATFLCPSLGIRFSMLVAFLLAVRRVAPALADINASLVEMSRSERNLEMIESLMNQLPQEKEGGLSAGKLEEVRFEGVGFSYASRPDHLVLKEVNAIFRRGTVTAVVGPTGSGKSTIAHLLIGLYVPSMGRLSANGVPFGHLDLQVWRKKIGFVPQDVFVFNTTIQDNIAFGDGTLSDSQIEWAARVAQLHDFVCSLPEGYGTVVGDRGLRLSGGQCQRLAIARAILRRPEILIFDEATSALDNLTEAAVHDAISAAHRESIVILIAHRLSTVKSADQILVLEGGQVVGMGAHDSLIRQGGLYARLYQQEDEAQAAVPVESEHADAAP